MTTMRLLVVLLSTCMLSRSGVASHTPSLAEMSSLRTNRRRLASSSDANESPPADPMAGVICSLSGNADTRETETHTISFYYGLGTIDSSLDNFQVFELQQKLFHAIENSLAWCYEEAADTSPKGQNRRLSQLQQRSRDLGILAVGVGPTEANVDGCPQTKAVANLMNETGASLCQLNEGSIRVLTHAGNTLEYMSSVLLQSLRTALNNDMIWKDWKSELKDMAFLTYMGATMEDVYGPVVVVPPVDTAIIEADESRRGLVLGIGVPIILLLMLLGFVAPSKKRRQVSERGLRDLMNSEFVLVGTGDPPASFHEGLYHYMRDGTRYLSTSCEGCLETRRNSFFTDDNLGTIMEGTEFEENMLVTANPNDVGKRTSSMDVHKCSSSTCTRCVPALAHGTKFVQARDRVNNSQYAEV